MRSPIDFIPYIVNPATGLCRYKNANGITEETPISNTLIDSHIRAMPGGWEDQQLTFTRNSTYKGINRGYSYAMNFVKDGADIVREWIYTIGIDAPLLMVIFKRNATGIPTTFNLYCKMNIDLINFDDSVTEGIKCNLLEGGVSDLLKRYENQTFEIPCDGSDPSNKKVLLDGLLVPDVFNFQFVPVNDQYGSTYSTLPITFINNEGDNFGIVRNNPGLNLYPLSNGGGNPWAKGNDFLFYSASPIDIRVKGSITIGKRFGRHSNEYINLFLATSASVFENITVTTGTISKSASLIPNIPGDNTAQIPQYAPASYEFITQETTYHFDKQISLQANEKLFMLLYQLTDSDNSIVILSGDFTISFNSSALPATPWVISWYDVGVKLLQQVCLAASTSDITYNYGLKSDLLFANQNLLITSGDALRAAGDSNYQKFYNSYNLNNSPTSGVVIEYGPVLKVSLKDYFKACDTMFCCALGSEIINGQEFLFIEKMQYAFDPTSNVMNIGEVANMKIAFMKELAITGFKIGYQPQTYDQKAGKYEANTTAEWSTNQHSTVSTIMDIVSPWRADPYGIQRLIAGIASATTSTTNNDSDNSVFIINSDLLVVQKDKQEFTFNSLVADYNLDDNTNIKLVSNNAMQAINVNSVAGTFLSLNNDPSIYVFAEPGLNANKDIDVSYIGQFLGRPDDFIKIDILINENIVDTQTFPASTTNPVTVIDYTMPTILSRTCVTGDSIRLQYSSSVNIDNSNNLSFITNAIVKVTESDHTTLYWSVDGQLIPLNAGQVLTLMALPNAKPNQNSFGIPVNSSGVPILAIGFQYYRFNSILGNPFFDYRYTITQAEQGAVTETTTYSFFKNGKIIDTLILNGTPILGDQNGSHAFPSEKLNVGDIFFILASVTNMSAQVQFALVRFTSNIDVLGLKRVQYDYIQGVPNIAKDINGIVRTDAAGAIYNVEFVSPLRMLERWFPYFSSILYNLKTKSILFCSLSKNQYLVTSINGKVYAENANIPISNMGDGFFLPFLISCDVETNDTFSEAQTGAANSVVKGSFNGFDFTGFPENLSQKPALNETQNWKLRAAESVDLTQLLNLQFAKLNDSDMLNNTMKVSGLCSLKFVPKGQTLDPKYRTPDPDYFLFKDTVKGWANPINYSNPWYTNNKIPLQVFAKGLSNISAQIFNCCGDAVGSNLPFTPKTTNGIPAGSSIGLYEIEIDVSAVPPGGIYIEMYGGDGAVTLISEPIDLRAPNASDRVLLFEFTNSKNKQWFITDTGFTGNFYVAGYDDNRSRAELTYALYVDQPQDITLLNAIAYRTSTLQIGAGPGVPDYVIEKLISLMGLDTVLIEGTQYTIDSGSKWETVNPVEGNPSRYWKTTIRRAKNNDGISVGADGYVDDATMELTLDASAIAGGEPTIINTTITTE